MEATFNDLAYKPRFAWFDVLWLFCFNFRRMVRELPPFSQDEWRVHRTMWQCTEDQRRVYVVRAVFAARTQTTEQLLNTIISVYGEPYNQTEIEAAQVALVACGLMDTDGNARQSISIRGQR